jgi:hypothetical protein
VSLVVGSGIALASVRPSAQLAVFDRTVVCKTRIGYVRVAAGRNNGQPHSGGVLNVNGDSSRGTLAPPGGTAVSGLPIAMVIALTAPDDLHFRGASADMKNCARTTNRVPLTGKGLPAPVAFDATAICPTGGRVLVRLRYTYVPGPHSPDFDVGGRMLSASLAIRSYRTLKPVVFAELTAGGTKLRFFSASSCTTSS